MFPEVDISSQSIKLNTQYILVLEKDLKGYNLELYKYILVSKISDSVRSLLKKNMIWSLVWPLTPYAPLPERMQHITFGLHSILTESADGGDQDKKFGPKENKCKRWRAQTFNTFLTIFASGKAKPQSQKKSSFLELGLRFALIFSRGRPPLI